VHVTSETRVNQSGLARDFRPNGRSRVRISVSCCNIVAGQGRAIFPLQREKGEIYESSRDEFGIQLSVRCCPARADPLRASCFVSKESDVMRDGLNQKEYLHR